MAKAKARKAKSSAKRSLVSETFRPLDPKATRSTYFVPATDPRITADEAWKYLMQFREELLSNSRTDSPWWEFWIASIQRYLYGGGNYGDGFYGPGHRVTTTDAVVCLDTVKARQHAMYSKGKRENIDSADDRRTVFFPPRATYDYPGFVLDWNEPFPAAGERVDLIEWVESWIDEIARKLASDNAPPSFADMQARQLAIDAVLNPKPQLTSEQLAGRFKALGQAYLRVRATPPTMDDIADSELAVLDEQGGRLYCAAAKVKVPGFLDLTPPIDGWIPPFDIFNPEHGYLLRVGFQQAWVSVLMTEAKRNPLAIPGGDNAGGAVFKVDHYDAEDGVTFGMHQFARNRWREWVEACNSLCTLLADRCTETGGTESSHSETATDTSGYRPAAWFGKDMRPRLRQAARSNRKTKRVATRKDDGVLLYSVTDARRWWPEEVPKDA